MGEQTWETVPAWKQSLPLSSLQMTEAPAAPEPKNPASLLLNL